MDKNKIQFILPANQPQLVNGPGPKPKSQVKVKPMKVR